MGKGKKNTIRFNNRGFMDSIMENIDYENDYFNRLRKICLAMFEWENLPKTMDARYLEITLFMDGIASSLYDKDRGIINTRCCSNGRLNIYELPTAYNCYSIDFHTSRIAYNGLTKKDFESLGNGKKWKEDKDCVICLNNYDRLPTLSTIYLFAKRLAKCDIICDINLNAQKTPYILATDDKQKLTLENLYSQLDGNRPLIVTDKNAGTLDALKVLKTDAPYIIDKVCTYKKEIWNDFLTYMGINNINIEKAERLIKDEANQNNEVINLNLQSLYKTRKKFCEEFNERFNENISVKVSSDLHNIIKNEESIITGYRKDLEKQNLQEIEEVV